MDSSLSPLVVGGYRRESRPAEEIVALGAGASAMAVERAMLQQTGTSKLTEPSPVVTKRRLAGRGKPGRGGAEPSPDGQRPFGADPFQAGSASDAKTATRRLWFRKLLQISLDGAGLVAGMAVANAFTLSRLPGDWEGSYLLGLASVPVWLALFWRCKLYAARSFEVWADELGLLVQGIALGAAALSVLGWAFAIPIPREWLLLSAVLGLAFVTVERQATRMYFRHLRATGRSLRRTIVVGDNEEARTLRQVLRSTPELGYDVVGYLSNDLDHVALQSDDLPLGGVGEAELVAAAEGATTAFIVASALDLETVTNLARRLHCCGLHVELAPGLRDIAPERLTVRSLGRHPVIYLEPARQEGWRATAKRCFDWATAMTMLVLSIPILAVAAVMIKATSKGPVLFRQERIGQGGRTFHVLKFRSMVVGAEALLPSLRAANEADGPLFKIKADPRITRVGQILRRYSLDELPQLINVVCGHMSLVGPRPALASEVHAWTPELHDRLRVKPGITGMWQVSGRSNASFEDYVRLDLYYVDNWTLGRDLAILARTVPSVLFSRGAY
jgi:exopolysaccharide biosynthesis polyprenyl glycosylphosphotransferase